MRKGLTVGVVAVVLAMVAGAALSDLGGEFWGAILVLLLLIAAVLFFTIGPALVERSLNRTLPHDPYEISPEARERHEDLVVVDWHSDSLLWDRDLLQRGNRGHVDIPRLEEGNVAVQMFTAVTKSPRGQNYERNTGNTDNITLLAVMQRWPPATWRSLTERALHQARRLHGFAAAVPERLCVVRTREQLDAVLHARRERGAAGGPRVVAALLGIEGAHALDGRLENIEVLFDAGYRMMSLHHFFDNDLGGSLHGVSGEGLTDFGRRAVRRIEGAGFIIDLAHSSAAVVDDVLALAERPVVVSHTGLYGACPSARNLKDDQVKRIAERGGLIAIGYWDGAVGDITPDGVVRSLRYAVDLVGADHVSLGSDFDGSVVTRFDSSELAILTQTMMRAGFADAAIEKVMGRNAVDFLLAHLPAGEGKDPGTPRAALASGG